LEGVVHGERHTLRGLEDEGISGRYGVGQKPERNHAGKIEWSDSGHNAERLANHCLVYATGHIFKVVALHHHGNAAGNFYVFDGAAHFAFGLGKGLAVFLRDDTGDVVEVIFEKLLELEEWLDAIFRWRAPPLGKSCGGGFDRGVYFIGLREWDSGK